MSFFTFYVTVSPQAIVVAWILRHPANMQAVVGTTDPKRLGKMCEATSDMLTREEWYALYRWAGNVLL
ncbi:MAG: hypothetical protein ATN35_11965 [Epulopiscium sp. Nele67-Bin004]|nr:MAG: hypothetical protein ATN35_11965 [Epulopiscium sp. Nele67-Bin004]